MATAAGLEMVFNGKFWHNLYKANLEVTPVYQDASTMVFPGVDLTAKVFPEKTLLLGMGVDGARTGTVATANYDGADTTVVLEEPILTANLMWGAVFASEHGVWPWNDGRIALRDIGAPSQATLEAALTFIGALKRGLVGTPGDWLISSALEIPEHITFDPQPGFNLVVATGVKVTINKLAEDVGRFQWITRQGTGEVELPPGAARQIKPEWWGSAGDGATVDRDPFLAAFKNACLGTPFSLRPGADYYMGVVDNQVHVLPFTGAKLKVIGNGAAVTTEVPEGEESYQSWVFSLTNPIYAIFDRGHFSNPGCNLNIDEFHGVHHVYVRPYGDEGVFGNITIRDCSADSGIAVVSVAGHYGGGVYPLARIANIRFEGVCDFQNIYKPLVCAQNGDNVSGHFSIRGHHRICQFYGVRNWDLSVHSRDCLGSTGQIVVESMTTPGVADPSTQGIRIKAKINGGETTRAVLFQNQSDDNSALVDDVHIDLSIQGTLPTGGAVEFAAFSLAGAPNATPGSKWDNIRLSGNFMSGNGINASVIATSVQTSKGNLIIDCPVRDSIETPKRPQIPGFDTIYTHFGSTLQTYTPNITFAGGNTGMAFQSGYPKGEYYIEGDKVKVKVDAIFTAKGTSTGILTIALPATRVSGPGTYDYLQAAGYTGMASLTGGLFGTIANGVDVAQVRMQGATGETDVTHLHLTDSSRVMLWGEYRWR